MEKESGETERSEKSGQDAAALLDAAALFGAYWPRGDTGTPAPGTSGHPLFGGIPGGYGNHLAGPHIANPFALMGGRTGSSSGYGPTHHAPSTTPGTFGSLGTLSVAASQAASLGLNPASAAWWTMASHLAAQDYLARLQASAAGMSFGGLPGAEGLVPGFPMLSSSHSQPHGSSKTSSSKNSTSKSSNMTITTSSPMSSTAGLSSLMSTSSHQRERERDRERDREREKEREREKAERERERADREREREREQRERERERELRERMERERATPIPPSSSMSSLGLQPPPGLISDPTSILGGVRLPPDTEIIKYTSSIVGPKIPGTTNRGRKKTISLDPPSVSVMPTHSSTGLLIERGMRKHSRARLMDPPEYRDSPLPSSPMERDRVEVIKLPAHSSNGTIPLNIPSYSGGNNGNNSSNSESNFYTSTPESDAPLNLSLKTPQSTTTPVNVHPCCMASTYTSSNSISHLASLSSLSSLSASLSTSTPTVTPMITDRISRRKPGPKPRRIIQSPAPTPIPASPSPSLAQLFAAADSPKPSSGSEDNDSTPRDGRPRNLGRGTSKPKKNTVASLLAQSRALGIKPTAGLDISPLNHQVSLLKSNILMAQQDDSDMSHHHLQDLHFDKSSDKDSASGDDLRISAENGDGTTSPSAISEADVSITKNKKHFASTHSEDNNKMRMRSNEGLSEDSSIADVSTDSGSASEGSASESDDGAELSESGPKKKEEEEYAGPAMKKRRMEIDMKLLRVPLERGWQRETLINGVSRTGMIKGEVTYVTPCGRRFKQYPDIMRYLEKNSITDLGRENFSLSSKLVIGDFLQPTIGDEVVRLSEEQVARRLSDLRNTRTIRPGRLEAAKLSHGQKTHQQLDRERAALIAKEAKRAAKEEATRNKEQARVMREQGRVEKQEALRKERELRNQQLMEGRKRLAFTLEQKMHIIREIEKGKSKSDVSRELGLASSTVATIWKNRDNVFTAYENYVPKNDTSSRHDSIVEAINEGVLAETARRRRQEELEKQRQEEQLRKQQERELKRQQAQMIKEQLYMQELNKQREMLYKVELERERRRQHMVLVKSLEARKRLEERERKRQEVRAEKLASKERKIEQRRIELELVKELRRPIEDMELTGDHKPLPTLNRIPGLKLSGQAFADTLMVFEFLHNFGETLGFDMESLPSLNSLQMALLNDEEAEEELLSIMTHLLVCAIEDPGIPNPARHTTILGQSLKQADITHANLSEILRIYLYANATGEVKALTGVHFERDREKKSDFHNNYGDIAPSCGKNAAFFEHLHENITWQMSEWLHEKPFLALNPSRKAQILAFLCNELLQNKAVLRQIDNSIETVGQIRKERWMMDTKIRKLRILHGRKLRNAPLHTSVKSETNGCDESNDTVVGDTKVKDTDDADDENEDDADEVESGNETDITQLDEDEDKNLTAEELNRKMERLSRQCDNSLQALSTSAQQLRAICFGQDRYWRRYWNLPRAGGIFVEGMESADLETFERGGMPPDEIRTVFSDDLKNKTSDDACEERLKDDDDKEKQSESDDWRDMDNHISDDARDDMHMDDETDGESREDTRNEHRKKRTREKNESESVDESLMESEDMDQSIKEEKVDYEEMERSNMKSEEVMTEDSDMSFIRDSNSLKDDSAERTGVMALLNMGKYFEGIKAESPSDSLSSKVNNIKCEDRTPETFESNLSSVKVEIKSDMFGAAIKMEDKCVDAKDKTVLPTTKCQSFDFDEKVSSAFLVHKPLQFERLGECMEKANTEANSNISTDNDKLNSLSHLCSSNSQTIFNNGKEVNGSFLLDGVSGSNSSEKNWFGILPKETCDLTSVTNGSPRLIDGTELRIPVYPPPSRLSSPSPGGSQCESPAPLILTAEEMAQLEQMKKTGPMEPSEAKPVPLELQRGWWRILDEDQLKTVLSSLHSRGVRERELKRIFHKYLDNSSITAAKLCNPGDKVATDFAITEMDSKISALPGGAPLVDEAEDWFPEVALRVDLAILEQVEALEDKVANASMQVKGWKLPNRVTNDEGTKFRPSCVPQNGDDDDTLDPIHIAKDRLISLEAAIERRYLKPPLGFSMADLNLSGMSGESPVTEDIPKGLVTWRDAVGRAHTAAQVAMTLYMLEASIAWDKSIMKAVSSVSTASGKGYSNCQFCHSGDNEDKLLLCDGCDKGYHTYCFKPKMDNIPDGDWYCFECMNKATGERNCIVCGKKSGKNLALCDLCPRAYHTDCLQPPLSKVPRGKWFCSMCQSKQPKKKPASKKPSLKTKESESTETAPPNTPPATPMPPTPAEDSVPPPASPAPSAASSTTSSPTKKERNKKLMKDLNPCRILLEDLETHDEAWPFLLPVNTKQFPTYKKIIKNPMDLSTIKKKLLDAVYKSREDFCADVRLIFNNCETFNEDDSPVGKAGHSMRSFFEMRWGELNGAHAKSSSSSSS